MVTLADYLSVERASTVREWRRGWYVHAVVYVVVMVVLISVNLVLIARTAADFVWFPFPLVGWGIGLGNHYLYGVRWADRDIRARQERTTGQATSPHSTRETFELS